MGPLDGSKNSKTNIACFRYPWSQSLLNKLKNKECFSIDKRRIFSWCCWWKAKWRCAYKNQLGNFFRRIIQISCQRRKECHFVCWAKSIQRELCNWNRSFLGERQCVLEDCWRQTYCVHETWVQREFYSKRFIEKVLCRDWRRNTVFS